MHEIQVKRISCSNFFSYGNNVNELDISKGMIWIKGANGAGKSSIVEALTFGFFGKPYRNIKIKEVKNNANKSKMSVTLEFCVLTSNDTIDEYIITREMTNSGSSKTKITLNTVEQGKNAISQKKLEDEVLGFNLNIWENIISLNTIQTKPIIDMEPKDKRKLVESVLTLHIDKYKKANGDALKEAQTSCVMAQSDSEKYSRDAEEMKVILEKLKDEKAEDLKGMEDQITVLEGEKVKLEKDKAKIVTSREKEIAKGVKKKKSLEKYTKIEESVNNYKIIINDIESAKNLEVDIQEKEKAYKESKKKASDMMIKVQAISLTPPEVFSTLQKELKYVLDEFITLKSVSVDGRMEELKTKAENLKVGVDCPTCGKPSTEDDIEKIKDEYREEYKTLNKKKKDTDKKLIANRERSKTLEEENVKITENLAKREKANVAHQAEATKEERDKEEWEMLKGKRDTHIERATGLWNEDSELNIDSIPLIEEKITDYNEELKTKAEIQKAVDTLRETVIRQKGEINNFDNLISSSQTQINNLSKTLEEKKNKTSEDAYSSTEKKLAGAEDDLKRAYDRITKYSDDIEICKYIEKMYNDDGIKKLVLGIFVPNLNKAIAHNLNLFELPFMIEFDDAMEYKFSSKFGLADVYNGLSQGQKRKLNFAISIAFRDFVTSIADFKINVLFLDEVLDISTDFEALSHMLTLVKDKAKEIDSIYLMTHRGDDFVEYFDSIVEIEYDGRYSSINVIPT